MHVTDGVPNPAEGGHRVENEDLVVRLGDGADFGGRIEHTGGRLAVDQRDVRDSGVALQCRVDRFGSDGFGFGYLDGNTIDAQAVGDLRDASAIGAVFGDEQFTVAWDGGSDGRLDGEGAAALHQDGRIVLTSPGEPHETFANVRYDRVVVRGPRCNSRRASPV